MNLQHARHLLGHMEKLKAIAAGEDGISSDAIEYARDADARLRTAIEYLRSAILDVNDAGVMKIDVRYFDDWISDNVMNAEDFEEALNEARRGW